MSVIKFNDVWEMYQIKFVNDGKPVWEKFSALKGINFEVEGGESIGIIGENGAGKSTILKIIAGMLKPEQGEISVSGRVSGLLELGAGFQPELTGSENIYLNAGLFGLTKSQIKERYEEIVNFSAIGRFINAPVKYYSQGMFVRLAFAIAIHVDPDILLIDDTLAVGDEYFQRKCIKKIFELKNQGKTIVFVTHDMNMLRRLCQRAVLIKDGKIIKDDHVEKVTPLYTQLIGQKEGVGVLEKKPLSLVFNNGRMFINWQGRLLTPGSGAYAAFRVLDRWHNSLQAEWEVKKENENKLVAQGTFYQLGMVQVWSMEICGDYEIKWGIEAKLDGPVEIAEWHTNVMLSSEYDDWFTTAEKGEFPSIDQRNKSWHALMGDNVFRKCVGVCEKETAEYKIPSLILSKSGHSGQSYSQVYNCDYVTNCRVLQYKNFLPQDNETLETGHFVYFSGKIILGIPNECIGEYVGQLDDEYTLSSGKLKLMLDNGRIILSYNGLNLTKANHICSSIYTGTRWYDSSLAHWQVKKDNKNKLVAQCTWKDLPLIQHWTIEIKDDESLKLRLGLQINQEISIAEQQVSFMFLQEYSHWHSEYGSGMFPGDFLEINADMLQRCIPGGNIGILDQNNKLPEASLTFSNMLNNFAKIFNSDFYNRSRVLRIESVYPENNLKLSAGTYDCFEMEVKLNGRSQAGSIKNVSNVIEGKGMKFIFEKGRGSIYWNNMLLTKHLGFYTSLRSHGRWHDSAYSAIWKIEETDKNRIKAQGKWLYLPLTQYWDIFLSQENTLEFMIKMQVEREIEIDRLQTNLMLSEKYCFWLTDKEKGFFPFFKDDVNDDWDLVYSASDSNCGIHISASQDDGKLIPNIGFSVLAPVSDWATNIINSDIYHRGRVLQHALSKKKIISSGEYDYFHGKITL